VRAAELKPQRQIIWVLGRDAPVLPAADGTLRAEDDAKPASAKSVQSYIAPVSGDRLAEARAAIEEVAASLPVEELNRIVFPLYDRFRPDVPDGAQGWVQRASYASTASAARWGDVQPSSSFATIAPWSGSRSLYP
jgi:hypothetical protein